MSEVEYRRTCEVFWGSHGCGLPVGHIGDHVCPIEDGCGMTVDQAGDDGTGFIWDLYGDDLPAERSWWDPSA